MSDQPKPATGEWTGEQLARRFHETYERRAPEFGYETRKETRAFDPTTPNGKLMVAVCSEIGQAINAALAAEKETTRLIKTAWDDICIKHGQLQHELAAEKLALEQMAGRYNRDIAAERSKVQTLVDALTTVAQWDDYAKSELAKVKEGK